MTWILISFIILITSLIYFISNSNCCYNKLQLIFFYNVCNNDGKELLCQVKQDFRTKRTTRRIKQALIELLQTEPFEKITIEHIIKVAKVSRRTFYVHYHDKYELRSLIEDELLTNLEKALGNEHQKLTRIQGSNDPYLVKNTEQTFLIVLTALVANRASMATLLADNGDARFKLKVKVLIEDEIIYRLQKYHAEVSSVIPQDYAKAILVGNLMDLIIIWLQKKHPESPKDFAHILTYSRTIAPLELLHFS